MKTVEIVVLAMLALLFLPRRSHAYIDPGTGSFVIQMLVVAAVGVVFVIRTYWHTLKTI